MRHSIQAIFWKVLGSGIERDYFFTVLIEADTKTESEENLSIYYLILRLNNALKYLADSKIKQGDCNSPYVISGNLTQPEIFLKKVQKGLKTTLPYQQQTKRPCDVSSQNYIQLITCVIISYHRVHITQTMAMKMKAFDESKQEN